jgi:hypothetical protein
VMVMGCTSNTRPTPRVGFVGGGWSFMHPSPGSAAARLDAELSRRGVGLDFVGVWLRRATQPQVRSTKRAAMRPHNHSGFWIWLESLVRPGAMLRDDPIRIGCGGSCEHAAGPLIWMGYSLTQNLAHQWRRLQQPRSDRR